MEGDSSIRIPGFLTEPRGWRKGGKRDRTAMFNNVLGISVEECTIIVCEMHAVIQLPNELRGVTTVQQNMKLCLCHIEKTLQLQRADTKHNIFQKYAVVLPYHGSTWPTINLWKTFCRPISTLSPSNE